MNRDHILGFEKGHRRAWEEILSAALGKLTDATGRYAKEREAMVLSQTESKVDQLCEAAGVECENELHPAEKIEAVMRKLNLT